MSKHKGKTNFEIVPQHNGTDLVRTDDSRLSDDRTASGFRTATTVVSVSAATAPSTGQILKATSDTAATWQNESGGSPSSSIVEATAQTTTTSATDVLVNSMTTTPASGTYVVWFSGDVDNSVKANKITMSIYAAGVQAASSERSYTPGGNNYWGTFCAVARVTVNGSQAIEGRWRTTGSTASMYARNLLIVKVA